MTSTCPRCTGKDGAHYMECVVGRLFERLMGADYPWKAPIAPAPEITRDARQLMDAQVRAVAAEDAALMAQLRAVAAEEADEPEPEPSPAPVEATAVREATAVESRPARPKPGKPGSGAWVPEADTQAAIDLFVSEMMEKAKPREWVAHSEVAAAYEKWRHNIDAPALETQVLSRGLSQAGLLRSQATPAQAKQLGGARGTIFPGWKLKGVAPHTTLEFRGQRKLDAWQEAVQLHVKRFMDDCLILGENGHNGTSWVERRDWVPGYGLAEAYSKWRQKLAPDAPELVQRDVSMGLKSNGYMGRQVHVINGEKPMLYYGLVLRPELNWGKPRASETVDKEDHTGTKAIRSLMKQAKVAARPAPEPAPAPAPKPNLLVALQMEQTKADNNGWFKAPAAGNGTTSPALTIEDIEAENAAVTTKKRSLYTGERPGQEIPKEYRELVAELLELPGWRYAKHNARGKGKPRIYNPKGQMLCLPNTPSDVKGLMATKTMLRNSLGAPL